MRRALLLAVLAAPALAGAQTVSPGAIQFSKNGGQDLVHGPFINAAECPATSTNQIYLSWNTALLSGAGWPAAARYQVYVSNKQHPGTSPNPCTTAPNGTDTFAGAVGDPVPATAQTQNLVPYATGAFVAALNDPNLTCSVTADTSIYVCVQASNANTGSVVGFALGTLTLSTWAPGAPTGVSATPADDGALRISWTAPSSTAYDYVLTADGTPTDATLHTAGDIRALSYLLTGLTNGVTYTISVYARSQAGNASTAATTTATPVPVLNFWDLYHDAPPNGFGGREQGGCSSGAAGPEALLALAALLAKLRRRA